MRSSQYCKKKDKMKSNTRNTSIHRKNIIGFGEKILQLLNFSFLRSGNIIRSDTFSEMFYIMELGIWLHNNLCRYYGIYMAFNSYLSHRIIDSFPRIIKCEFIRLKPVVSPQWPKAMAEKNS